MEVLPLLGAGMLALADRNFPGYDLWGQAAATGADLLWRVGSSFPLPVVTSSRVLISAKTSVGQCRRGGRGELGGAGRWKLPVEAVPACAVRAPSTGICRGSARVLDVAGTESYAQRRARRRHRTGATPTGSPR